METKEVQNLLTPKEAAAILGIKLSTLYKYSMAGTIPTVKILGNLRFRSDTLQAFIDSNSRQPIKQALAPGA